MKVKHKIAWIGIIICTYLWGAPFTINDDQTVTDSATGLIWQRCSAGLGVTSTLLNCNSGTIKSYTWSEAISYCNALILGGKSDWRLPNINELGSIVDYEISTRPTITGFPNSQSDYYWSSSTASNNTSGAWGVSFFTGSSIVLNSKVSSYYVRCVRGP